MTWYMPTEEKCPVCGKTLFKKRANQLICLNEQCITYVKEEPRVRKTKAEDSGADDQKAAKKTTAKRTKKAASRTTKKTAAKTKTAKKSTAPAKRSKAKAEDEA